MATLGLIMDYIGFNGIVTSVVVLILGIYIRGQFGKMEKRGESRVEETMLKIRSLNAIGKLTYATSLAVRDGKVNGELTSAIEVYKCCQKELDDFLLKQFAEHKEE